MPNIEFKSCSSSIIVVYLDSSDLAEIELALSAKLKEMPQDFFVATPVVADLRLLSSESTIDFTALQQLFKRHQLLLLGISGSDVAEEILAAHGMAKFEINQVRPSNKHSAHQIENPVANEPTPAIATEQKTSGATKTINSEAPAPQNQTFRGTVRSGQRLYAAGGDLTIIGTVGAGAEVVADGNIYVLGSLRGRAFAGAQGNDEKHIFASDFQAQLVSIAGCYQNYEQLDPYHGGKNCLITLNKDETMLIVSL